MSEHVHDKKHSVAVAGVLAGQDTYSEPKPVKQRTPGKWEVFVMDNDSLIEDAIAILPQMTQLEWRGEEALSEKNSRYDIAHCYGPDRYGNAALIAAAPDLYAALSRILRAGLTEETRKAGRDALKKVKS